MKTVRAIYANGVFRPTEPADLPENLVVEFEPRPLEPAKGEKSDPPMGIRDEDWPQTPEGIAQLLAAMDQIEPLIFTDEERAAWEAARAEQKAFEKSGFEARAEKLRGAWD